MAKEYGDKEFNRDFKKLVDIIMKRLRSAESIEDAKQELDMLEGLSSSENSPAPAKTLYGIAYLMEDKPWYDFDRGFSAVKEAAEQAADNEPFCWFILGSLYLNGKGSMAKDPIQAKYWISKAAEAGYRDALMIQEIEWGDNPVGFKQWLSTKLEREELRNRRLRIIIPILVIIVLCLVAFLI